MSQDIKIIWIFHPRFSTVFNKTIYLYYFLVYN